MQLRHYSTFRLFCKAFYAYFIIIFGYYYLLMQILNNVKRIENKLLKNDNKFLFSAVPAHARLGNACRISFAVLGQAVKSDFFINFR